MEISSILIGLVLISASTFFVSLPFRKNKRNGVKKSKAKAPHDGNKALVLSALRDLDFDFKTGKVSEEDYTPLRARLMAEAAHYMEREKEEDEKLEALIQARRVSAQQGNACGSCGARLEAGQRFCSKCGTPVGQALCPQCGKKIRAGDPFCPSCGTRLEACTEPRRSDRMEAVVQS